MYCGNCGAQNPDGAAHCGNCGAPLAQTYQPAPGPGPVPGPGPYVKSAGTNKNKIIGICVAAAAVILVIVLAVVLFGGNSPKSAAEDMMKALFDGDVDKIVYLIPVDLIKGMARSEGISKSEAVDEITNGLDSMLGSLGGVLKMFDISIKAVDEDDYDRDELRDIQDAYEEYDVKVKDARIVEVDMTIKYMGEKETETMDVPVVKIGGSWYVDFMNMEDAFDF